MAEQNLVTACGHLEGCVNELCSFINGTGNLLDRDLTLSEKALLVVGKKFGVVDHCFLQVRSCENYKTLESRNVLAFRETINLSMDRNADCIEALDSAIDVLEKAERTVQQELERTVKVLYTVRREMEALREDAFDSSVWLDTAFRESRDDSRYCSVKRARIVDEPDALLASAENTKSVVGSEDTH